MPKMNKEGYIGSGNRLVREKGEQIVMLGGMSATTAVYAEEGLIGWERRMKEGTANLRSNFCRFYNRPVSRDVGNGSAQSNVGAGT